MTSFSTIALQYTNRKYLIDVVRDEVFMVSGVLYVWIQFNLNLFHSSQQGQLSSSLSQKAMFRQSLVVSLVVSCSVGNEKLIVHFFFNNGHFVYPKPYISYQPK